MTLESGAKRDTAKKIIAKTRKFRTSHPASRDFNDRNFPSVAHNPLNLLDNRRISIPIQESHLLYNYRDVYTNGIQNKRDVYLMHLIEAKRKARNRQRKISFDRNGPLIIHVTRGRARIAQVLIEADSRPTSRCEISPRRASPSGERADSQSCQNGAQGTSRSK